MRWPCLWDWELKGSVWLPQGGGQSQRNSGQGLEQQAPCSGSRSSALAKPLPEPNVIPAGFLVGSWSWLSSHLHNP